MKRMMNPTENKTTFLKSGLKLLIPMMFTLLLFSTAQAQNADEYFHNGAKSFIGAELQDAIAYVEEGLSQFPADAKLNALLEKLKEQQEQQQQQQQEQNEEQQDQEQQEQQEQEQNQQEQDDQNQEKQEEQQESSEDGESDEDPLQQMEEALESQSISKEDAEKILQALAQKEKELLKEFKKQKKEGSAKHEKDW